MWHSQDVLPPGSFFECQVLGIRKKKLGEEHPRYAASLNNLAELYRTMGRYDQAEPLYKQALVINKKALGEDHPDYATSLNNLALIFDSMGRYDQAEPLYKRALDIKGNTLGEEHPGYATSLHNLAGLYKSMGRYDQAEPLYKQALDIRKKTVGKEHPNYATSLNNLAALYRSMGRYDQAKLLYKHAAVIWKNTLGEEHPDYAAPLNSLALIYHSMGRYDQAEPLFKQASMILKKTLGEEHPDYATSLNNLADLYYSTGRYDQAETLYKQALSNHLHQIRTFFPIMSEKEKAQFYRSINFHFEIFHSFALQRTKENPGIHTFAYNNQLAIKSLLLNSVIQVKKQILNSQDAGLLKQYEAWIDQKEYLANIYKLSKAGLTKRGINRDSLETVANNLEKELSRRSDAFKNATTLPTWKDIQKALKPGEAAIEMVRFRWHHKTWTDTVYYAALIVTPDSKDHPDMVVLTNGNDLEDPDKFLDEYRRCVAGIKTPIPYQHYWQPIQEKLTREGIQKVYFSPDGIYNVINLNILYNSKDNTYVSDEIDIHLVTSTKDILSFGQSAGGTRQAALFGDPTYKLSEVTGATVAKEQLAGKGFPGLSDDDKDQRPKRTYEKLPGTGVEIAAIETILRKEGWTTESYLGVDALEAAVKAVNNPTVLHIATHGFFIPKKEQQKRERTRFQLTGENQPSLYLTNPMLRSGLVLAGAQSYQNAAEKPDTEDGILTAYEASNLDLRYTELVVLSACETGLGDIKNGEGVYGLQRAFKVAGAKTILMSLWRVDDEVTQKLMTTFYKNWLQHNNKRKAFRDAQAEIRKDHPEPKYWGAFVMVGE